MKAMAKTLVLVLLLTVICSATYIAVMAAEDPTANGTARQNNYDYSVLLPRESAGLSDIENAPALRIDNKVVIPQTPAEPTTSVEGYIPPPETGAVSDTLQLLGAVALLGASLWVTRGRKLPTA